MLCGSCNYFDTKKCFSCSLLDKSADEYLSTKEQYLTDAFGTTFPSTNILPFWTPRAAFASRNKAKLSVSGKIENPCIGLTDSNLSGVELLDCPLHKPELNEILHTIKTLIPKYKLTPYDIKSRTGELKGLILKTNENSSETILRFILRSSESIIRIKKAIVEIQNKHPQVKVISANIQPIPHAILEGEVEQVLTKKDYITEKFGEISLVFGPQSFSQVTHETAEELYSYVTSLIKKSGALSMLDLYCGVGGFSLSAAKSLNSICGIELSENAVKNAKLGAELNGIKNAKFYCQDVKSYIETQNSSSIDLIVCNPPRRGLGKETTEQVLRILPRYLIYSSCNPESLLQDLSKLKSEYKLLSLKAFDMFPLTKHLEVVAYLEK